MELWWNILHPGGAPNVNSTPIIEKASLCKLVAILFILSKKILAFTVTVEKVDILERFGLETFLRSSTISAWDTRQV